MGNFFYKAPTTLALCGDFCKKDYPRCRSFRYTDDAEAYSQYCEFFEYALNLHRDRDYNRCSDDFYFDINFVIDFGVYCDYDFVFYQNTTDQNNEIGYHYTNSISNHNINVDEGWGGPGAQGFPPPPPGPPPPGPPPPGPPPPPPYKAICAFPTVTLSKTVTASRTIVQPTTVTRTTTVTTTIQS
ncbi:hypothetical protein N0V90_010601 [Kalmusia sp. IMI 367209]|nr:hypothetical protein N0V90_010601 [Kalmusia sp. IMI 367209]